MYGRYEGIGSLIADLLNAPFRNGHTSQQVASIAGHVLGGGIYDHATVMKLAGSALSQRQELDTFAEALRVERAENQRLRAENERLNAPSLVARYLSRYG